MNPDDDVCVELVDQNASVLRFCAQLHQSKCLVIAIHSTTNRVWIENSPLFQTCLLTTPNGLTCAGFGIRVLKNTSKGKKWKVVKGTYLDVLDFVKKYTLVNPNITAWSPPTNLHIAKKVYFCA